ncbi:MAG: hypothetical protein IPM13_19175 [Phycisphaerales bacterium]|nr:hypothetical protein [Phycisphaerales bacterium]
MIPFVPSLSVCLILAALASAQQGSVTVSTTLFPRSVVIAGPDHVICSFGATNQSGVQQAVNVSVPNNPTNQGALFDPNYGDQFSDAVFTPAFGGRLVTAHRFGGINLIDASVPWAMVGAYSQIQPPKYSQEGLEIFADSTGVFVGYSEHNVGNTGGGLRIFRMSANALTEILPSHIVVGQDANACEFSRDGRYLWQFGSVGNNSNDQRLFTYTTNAFSSGPTLISATLVPGPNTYGDKDLKQAMAPNLIAALGFEGLAAVDVTTPSAPVFNQVYQSSIVFFDGVTFFPGSDYALTWGYVQIGTSFFDFLMVLDASFLASRSRSRSCRRRSRCTT